MPELPEVNTFKKYFDGTSLHQTINSVEVSDGKILRNISPTSFKRRLKNRQFVDSYRQGKYLFAQIDNGHHLLLHFGMTGDLNYYSAEEDRAKYERFTLHFDNGYRLGFDCPRKFARICYIENLPTYLQEIGLGSDALVISLEEFLQLAGKRSATIKGFLLNQKLIAGVGNLYADEICYQTRIHPATPVNELSKKQLKAVFHKMKEVLEYAVNRDAYYKDYPEDWLWQWRVEGGEGPKGFGPVKKMKVAGRTTFYAEGWQKL